MAEEKKGLTHNELVFLWNEVQLAGDIMLRVDTGGTWGSFTCSEIEALGDVFRSAGRADVRDFIIAEHKAEDDEDDLENHLYNEEDPEPGAVHPAEYADVEEEADGN